jgi:glycosyltransferase involved in cell wall biosynthesis
MGQRFFSIITPAFRIERLVEDTLKSVLSQTFSDWELICIDDGSPDKSGEICDGFASKDNRIKVIHKENEGLAQARNDGIKNATGKYFIILEGSDLFYDENTLQDIYNDLKKSDYPDIYFARLQDMLEGSNEITNVQAKYSIDGEYKEGGQKLLCKLIDNNDILAVSSPVNKAFKREFIVNNDLTFCKGIYHDDDEFIPRAIAACNTAFFTDRIIYNAMDWDGSFVKIKNEKGLVKKSCDKMFLADKCCRYFEEKYDNKEVLKKAYEYYMRIFTSGVLGYYDIENEEYRAEIFEYLKSKKSTLVYLKKSGVKNLKILYYCFKIFGLKFGMKILKKRYGG